jgi:hypothetical protein
MLVVERHAGGFNGEESSKSGCHAASDNAGADPQSDAGGGKGGASRRVAVASSAIAVSEIARLRLV